MVVFEFTLGLLFVDKVIVLPDGATVIIEGFRGTLVMDCLIVEIGNRVVVIVVVVIVVVVVVFVDFATAAVIISAASAAVFPASQWFV